MLEEKCIWNATIISILQQKFENFCKLWVVDSGYTFDFVTVNSRFDTVSLCFFVINLSTVQLFVVD